MADPVLILGGTGMLGHEVVRRFAEAHAVHATARDLARAEEIGLPATLHRLDAYDPDELAGILEDVRPAAVVNCIGLVKQLAEGNQPIPAVTVNSLFPHVAAEAARTAGARFLHVSTDCVFSGDLPLGKAYDEAAPPDPQDLYGRSKLLGEVYDQGAVTIRSSIVGWEIDRASGLLEWFVRQDGKEITGFRKALFSGLTTRALGDVLVEIVDSFPELTGLYHVASQPISKLELIELFRERLDVSCTVNPADEPVVNRVLDPRRFGSETGFEPPSWPSMLDEYLSAPRVGAALREA
jgi:dTDP-4-dehydrorhamnose reductase